MTEPDAKIFRQVGFYIIYAKTMTKGKLVVSEKRDPIAIALVSIIQAFRHLLSVNQSSEAIAFMGFMKELVKVETNIPHEEKVAAVEAICGDYVAHPGVNEHKLLAMCLTTLAGAPEALALPNFGLAKDGNDIMDDVDTPVLQAGRITSHGFAHLVCQNRVMVSLVSMYESNFHAFAALDDWTYAMMMALPALCDVGHTDAISKNAAQELKVENAFNVQAVKENLPRDLVAYVVRTEQKGMKDNLCEKVKASQEFAEQGFAEPFEVGKLNIQSAQIQPLVSALALKLQSPELKDVVDLMIGIAKSAYSHTAKGDASKSLKRTMCREFNGDPSVVPSVLYNVANGLKSAVSVVVNFLTGPADKNNNTPTETDAERQKRRAEEDAKACRTMLLTRTKKLKDPKKKGVGEGVDKGKGKKVEKGEEIGDEYNLSEFEDFLDYDSDCDGSAFERWAYSFIEKAGDKRKAPESGGPNEGGSESGDKKKKGPKSGSKKKKGPKSGGK